MATMTTAKWYDLVCTSVRSVIDEYGGATAMTKDEWREALMDDNPDLRDCPPSVFEHLSLGLKCRGLSIGALRGYDGEVPVIFCVKRFDLTSARTKCDTPARLSDGTKEYYDEYDFEPDIEEVLA